MLERTKNITQHIFRATQKVLLTVFLFILYVFGFGLTAIVLRIFNHRVLIRKPGIGDSFWIRAEGYEKEDSSHPA